MKKSSLHALALIMGLCFGYARAVETNAPPVEDPGDTYLLAPGDKVVYTIKEDPSTKGNGSDVVLVSALAQMRFPASHGFETFIIIDARGKTIKQVREELKKELDDKYYQNATVTLNLEQKSQRSAQVYFTGQVRNGVLALKEGGTLTLYEALVQVGFTEFANLSKVRINRIDPQTKVAKDIIVDVKQILKKGNRDKDVILMDGDRIDVPEKGIVF